MDGDSLLRGWWADGGGGNEVGWLNEPDDWVRVDDSLHSRDCGVGVGYGRGCGHHGISAASSNTESSRLSVDDIGVGSVDEVELVSAVIVNGAWNSNIDRSSVLSNVLRERENKWWEVTGGKVHEVDREGRCVSVHSAELHIDGGTFGDG